MRRALLVGMGLVLVGGMATPAVTPVGVGPASAAVTGAATPFDFDGDGYADLAVGVPGEGLRGKASAGAVQVLYGSASGPTAHDQVWHQGRKGVKGALEKSDLFGKALDSGDFDADGYADLAIGIPGEGFGRKREVGAVQVLYGSPAGLTAAGDQVWHQGKKGVPGTNEWGDYFGSTLAVGDFDGDGYADLAVGASEESTCGHRYAGRVTILRGSARGLAAAGAQSWDECSAGVASRLGSPGWNFGRRLAAGDVNGDGRDDLAIAAKAGSWRERQAALHVLVGSTGGLTAAGGQYLTFSDFGLTRDSSLDSLWLGDVNADGHDDLTLGAEDGVAVLHGHADGLHPGPLAAPGQPGADTLWSHRSGFDPPTVSGDFTGDGYADLALHRARYGFGIVIGTPNGLGSDITWWPLEGADGPTSSNALPLSGGDHAWLILGMALSPVGSVSGAGTVAVLQGTPLGAVGQAMVWSQNSPGVKGRAEFADNFGQSVSGFSALGG